MPPPDPKHMPVLTRPAFVALSWRVPNRVALGGQTSLRHTQTQRRLGTLQPLPLIQWGRAWKVPKRVSPKILMGHTWGIKYDFLRNYDN